jgi:hypothetical protein
MGCSPRDFLSRRLAADLIAGSDGFRAPQAFQLHTGVVSNDDSLSQDYLVLQHRGWISAAKASCPAGVSPAPCWDITLTPSGVDTFQGLIPGDLQKQSFTILVARRELLSITGISRQGNMADIEFVWKWVPLNEVGAALYPENLRYRSMVSFRDYDDGWRPTRANSHQTLDEALKNAERE